MCNKSLSLIRVPNQLVGWVKDKCESADTFFPSVRVYCFVGSRFFLHEMKHCLSLCTLTQINLHTHSTAELIS